MTANKNVSIVWLRNDLRLEDNPALHHASQHSETIYPIYIKDASIGAANNVWLHNSLNALNASMNDTLSIYSGCPKEIIPHLLKETNATSVFWNRSYDYKSIERDSHIKSELKSMNVTVKTFNGSLMWEPWEVLKKDETPYKVFTPYYRRGCLNAAPPSQPLPTPNLTTFKRTDSSQGIDSLDFIPKIEWHKEIERSWDISEKGAHDKLAKFLDHGIHGYKERRNNPAEAHVSMLSPYLQSGEISPRTVWYAVQERLATNDIPNEDADHFLSELGWREFSYSLIYHFPHLKTVPLQPRFEKFPWNDNDDHLTAWKKGLTGYPIVDAGMRELWRTGWMHNRVRMIVGSFLVKHLLLHWHHGEEWFWNCLIDADYANNSASWQWIAGCGADAAPYFRIFNPITQGEKFDPKGEYIRKYVPELKNLPDKYLNKPWEAPPLILAGAGITLGKDYPKPIVDHSMARTRALEAFQATKT